MELITNYMKRWYMMSQNCLLLYRDIPTDKSHDKYD